MTAYACPVLLLILVHFDVSLVQGNYTQYVAAKSEREALQWTAYEKQQKEIEKLQDMVRRLSGERVTALPLTVCYLDG